MHPYDHSQPSSLRRVVARALLSTMVIGTAVIGLQGCVVRPARPARVVEVEHVEPCPPGTHPGPEHHRCFAD